LKNYRAKLIKQGKSAVRINNHISAFKAMYHWVTENELVDSVPNLNAVKKLPRSKLSKPIFSSNEIKKLLDCANTKMKAMICLALNCGLGCTDRAELLWEHLGLDAGRLSLARTKTGVNGGTDTTTTNNKGPALQQDQIYRKM